MSRNIEIPDPVIQARADWMETTDDEYVVEVFVGDESIFTTKVPRGWRMGEDHASTEEEAEKAAINEFGKRLRKLIGNA